MSDTGTTGQVLGASTAAVGGAAIASLPNTGVPVHILSYVALASGGLVLLSFVVTRILRKAL